MQKNIHLIAFNIPFPANYGGVIDVFYKIKALHKIGMKVHLHCFEYGREMADELLDICESVHYYKRNTGISQHFSFLPYIVKSRINKDLLEKLRRDKFPIIFEGLHCCGLIGHSALKHHLKIVRMHNVEWQYYEHLATKEANVIKRLFFKIEGWKLKRFESIIHQADGLLTISPNDKTYFETNYPTIKNIYIPAFHPNETILSKEGQGDYALFHGDLSVMDNELSALYLIRSVFNDLNIPFIVAGLNPTAQLLAEAKEHIKIKANLTNDEMTALIENAQVNVLFSFHSAGMKLKLLNALFKGRFCIVNSFMIDGTGLETYCEVGNDAESLKNYLKIIFTKTFTKKDIKTRKALLTGALSNENNAMKLIRWIEKIK